MVQAAAQQATAQQHHHHTPNTVPVRRHTQGTAAAARAAAGYNTPMPVSDAVAIAAAECNGRGVVVAAQAGHGRAGAVACVLDNLPSAAGCALHDQPPSAHATTAQDANIPVGLHLNAAVAMPRRHVAAAGAAPLPVANGRHGGVCGGIIDAFGESGDVAGTCYDDGDGAGSSDSGGRCSDNRSPRKLPSNPTSPPGAAVTSSQLRPTKKLGFGRRRFGPGAAARCLASLEPQSFTQQLHQQAARHGEAAAPSPVGHAGRVALDVHEPNDGEGGRRKRRRSTHLPANAREHQGGRNHGSGHKRRRSTHDAAAGAAAGVGDDGNHACHSPMPAWLQQAQGTPHALQAPRGTDRSAARINGRALATTARSSGATTPGRVNSRGAGTARPSKWSPVRRTLDHVLAEAAAAEGDVQRAPVELRVLQELLRREQATEVREGCAAFPRSRH